MEEGKPAFEGENNKHRDWQGCWCKFPMWHHKGLTCKTAQFSAEFTKQLQAAF